MNNEAQCRQLQVCGVDVDHNTVGVWYVQGKRHNVLAIMQGSDDGAFAISGRIRFYDPVDPDNDAWSGKDIKQPFSAILNATNKEAALADVRQWINNMPFRTEEPREFLKEGLTLQEFAKQLMEQNFNHVHEVHLYARN